jgi:FKBP-type peptidyl-prolyl cis-trans isomerase SlyD
MQISDPCVVSLTWLLSDAQNRPIDELKEPVDFYFGGDDLIDSVEQALEGHVAGDEVNVQLEPEQAFGDYNADLVCFEDRKLFPEPVEPGMAFEGLPPGHKSTQMPADAVYVVTEVYPSHVVLDANHPLAGMALRLAIRVRAVREATDEEIDAGTVGTNAVSVLGGDAPPGSRLH